MSEEDVGQYESMVFTALVTRASYIGALSMVIAIDTRLRDQIKSG